MLLDGGFVKYKLGSAKTQADSASISKFVGQVSALPILAGMRLHRIYFYDSRPLEISEAKPLGGGTIDFGATDAAARNKSLHSTLVREPFFALRFGELYLEGWRLRKKLLKKNAAIKIDHNDLEPNIRQKGVDMRIGLDIADLLPAFSTGSS